MLLAAVRRPILVLVATAAVAGCGGATKPASPVEPAAQAVNVQISPEQPQVAAGGTIPFAATVTGTANTSVSWAVAEVGGGTVTSAGVYTAPASAGTFHVTAVSAADGTRSATAAVTVVAPPQVAVSVTPATGSVNACQTLQLAATVTGAADTSVSWTVQEGAAGGTVSAAGLYTAPTGPGTYHVVATSNADPTRTATTTLTVNEVVLSVVVTPATVTLQPGGSAQFTATVTNTCGTFTATSTVLANGTVIRN